MDEKTFIKQIVAEDPSYKNIFSNLWQLIEDLRGLATLQEMVDFFRRFKEEQFALMRATWEKACGRPMTPEQEYLCFEAPKIKASLMVVEKVLEFIEHMYKANEIVVFFGLKNVAPLAINKKGRGWSKGGKQKAEANKFVVDERRKEILKEHEAMKKRSFRMSNSAIDRRIAEQQGISVSYVYQIRTGKLRHK